MYFVSIYYKTLYNMPAHRIFHTKEECIKLYNQCKNLTEFKAKHLSAFRCCVENGWDKEICHSFFDWDKPKTFEEAVERVKHYKDRSALWKNDHRMYYFLEKNNWLNKIPNLISKTDEKSKIHFVYVYEFPEYNTAYVGRTINIKQRHNQHLNKDCSISKFLKSKNIPFDYLKMPKILESNLTSKESQTSECDYIELYKEKGWTLLNKAKGGSVGSLSRKWTKNVCMELSKQFKTKKEFREAYRNAYFAAMEHKWLNEFTWLEKAKIKEKYTYEHCYNVAKKYKKFSDFRKNDSKIWDFSYVRNWLKDYDWLYIEEKNKPIVEYDINGCFVKKHTRVEKTHIRAKIRKNNNFAYGSFWFNEDDIVKLYNEIPPKIDLEKMFTKKRIDFLRKNYTKNL